MKNKFTHVNGFRNSWFMVGLDKGYSEVYAVLGEPTVKQDQGKVDVEWVLEHPSYPGEYICVWNWKNGPAYGEAESLEGIYGFSIFYTSKEIYNELLGLF